MTSARVCKVTPHVPPDKPKYDGYYKHAGDVIGVIISEIAFAAPGGCP